ncbi:hypothetical protein QOT17_002177 [Balamuthia mandrillaris]
MRETFFGVDGEVCIEGHQTRVENIFSIVNNNALIFDLFFTLVQQNTHVMNQKEDSWEARPCGDFLGSLEDPLSDFFRNYGACSTERQEEKHQHLAFPLFPADHNNSALQQSFAPGSNHQQQQHLQMPSPQTCVMRITLSAFRKQNNQTGKDEWSAYWDDDFGEIALNSEGGMLFLQCSPAVWDESLTVICLVKRGKGEWKLVGVREHRFLTPFIISVPEKEQQREEQQTQNNSNARRKIGMNVWYQYLVFRPKSKELLAQTPPVRAKSQKVMTEKYIVQDKTPVWNCVLNQFELRFLEEQHQQPEQHRLQTLERNMNQMFGLDGNEFTASHMTPDISLLSLHSPLAPATPDNALSTSASPPHSLSPSDLSSALVMGTGSSPAGGDGFPFVFDTYTKEDAKRSSTTSLELFLPQTQPPHQHNFAYSSSYPELPLLSASVTTASPFGEELGTLQKRSQSFSFGELKSAPWWEEEMGASTPMDFANHPSFLSPSSPASSQQTNDSQLQHLLATPSSPSSHKASIPSPLSKSSSQSHLPSPLAHSSRPMSRQRTSIHHVRRDRAISNPLPGQRTPSQPPCSSTSTIPETTALSSMLTGLHSTMLTSERSNEEDGDMMIEMAAEKFPRSNSSNASPWFEEFPMSPGSANLSNGGTFLSDDDKFQF